MTPSTSAPAPPRRWVPRGRAPADPGAAAELARAIGLPEPLCRLLVLRGHAMPESAKRFLRPRLDQLHDPFRLPGMEAAVERLDRALARGETILVHGDYDVDGVCAAALYTRVLRELGGRAVPFVPRRLVDGYDLGPAGIAAARAAGATLILTADCGVVAHEAVEEAARAGIDVVVTDHHTPGATLPRAVAVVNPNRADSAYPDPALAGAGVAFKVCEALVDARGGDPEALCYHLDLVALATIADLAPLTGENRVMVHYGLRVLAGSRKPGVRALVRSAGLAEEAVLLPRHVSHVLAPRINAAGRLGDAAPGVELLLAETEADAERLARALEEKNRERRNVDAGTFADALRLLGESYDPDRDAAVVLAARGWHPGVIGIVASRIVERIHRPTVLIALPPGGGHGRGSARSIPAFDLYAALRACAEHLERFGGHRQAAGLEVRADRVEAFRAAFCAWAGETLTPEDLVPELEIDLDVRLADANAELYRYLRHFGPFGIGNPAPVFAARGVGVAGTPREVGDGHVRLELVQDGTRLPAIGFRLAQQLRAACALRTQLDVAFQLHEDRWNGRAELQARLLDVRPVADADHRGAVAGP